ncbi:MAG: hypothetical protein M1837_007281 [Sclerophora amabilis]|nr:MAG: hypothetical protein M1837_007281 [Sclerophora amabilis]
MEHVAGVRLDEKWEEMNVLQHMQCTKALSKFAKDMEQINFPAYGSLYFENAIDPGLRVDFADGYCIGPHCGSTYWNCSPGERELYGESNSNHGPCEKPDFASLPDKISFVEGEEETEDEKKAKEDASICSQTFDVCMMGRVPKLARARELDEMLFRPFRYCHTSWRDSASAVRQELVDLGQHWVELGLTGTSPYLPTEKELAEHKKRYEDFDNAQRLKAGMMQALGVNSDGWFSEDRRNTVSEAYSKMYQMWIETAKDSEASEEDKDKVSPEKAQMLWPFDER